MTVTEGVTITSSTVREIGGMTGLVMIAVMDLGVITM